jgi:tetratricopeptide (TPR) repeat protein
MSMTRPMARTFSLFIWLAALAGLAPTAIAATAPEIFAGASRHVLPLEGFNDKGETVAQASATALGDGVAVTLCDLLPGAGRLQVTQERRKYAAYPRERDLTRNLCKLDVPGLRAGKVEIAALEQVRVGQRVYAIGNALGMGLSLSEGLVSGVRERRGETWIQTTAALAPGSEGGALYDEQGRLLGMTDYRKRDGQNINFAAPAIWLPEISARAVSTLADKDTFAKHPAECARLAESGDWKMLAETAEAWTRGQPEHSEAWFWLGLARERLENSPAAADAFEKSLERAPDSVTTALALARNRMRLKEADKALEVLRAAIAHNQEDADLWFAKVLAEDALNQGEAGLHSLEETLRLNPRHLAAWELRFNIARATNNPEGLRQAASNLTEIAPDNAEYWLLLAQAHLVMGRPARAWKAIGRAGEMAPDNADILVTRGAILARLGAFGPAIDSLKRGLAANPVQAAYAHAQIGDAYYQVNDYPEAIAALREAVRLAPEDLLHQFDLGVALKDSDRNEEALLIFQALRDKTPQDPAPWRQIGYVLVNLGRLEESIPALEQSLRLAPEQAKVWHVLGETQGKLGRVEEARRVYQRLRGLNPERAEQLYRAFLLVLEEQP